MANRAFRPDQGSSLAAGPFSIPLPTMYGATAMAGSVCGLEPPLRFEGYPITVESAGLAQLVERPA